MIPNHYSAKLSELDLQFAHAVRPGGNWKSIPESVPSQRLRQIRESYAAGQGSRSTYYGRLRPDEPSYTITTYFGRPGNGCHLHFDYDGGQHRVISEREAARLQSFPDSFEFVGTHSSIQKQIGNAVPPLLAYQIAKCFPFVGQFVDLFAGAGGLSLGFFLAGWKPLVANEIEESFAETYKRNLHPHVIVGDIRHPDIFSRLVQAVNEKRVANLPLLVLGGPPCQGFSTAGNARTMDDPRNSLFLNYRAFVEAVKPSGFIFENVPGLANIDGGAVFEAIKAQLGFPKQKLIPWSIRTELHAIPQRRRRIIMVSVPREANISPPEPLTSGVGEKNLFAARGPITVEEAISDLPALRPGEDGSKMPYAKEPQSSYQSWLRGRISIESFLGSV